MATSTDPMLYMFPVSFYSQKVRLALRQKGVKHQETLVNLRAGEQNSVWYLKLNPNGEVPAMTIGDSHFAQSEKLIDIIDQLPSDTNVRLVPDVTTAEGEDVATWRRKLDQVDCPNVTYGVLLNPELSVDQPLLPPSMRPSKPFIKGNYANVIKKFEQMKRENPELKEAAERKIKLAQENSVSMCDKENCSQLLDELEKLMDEVEGQLQKTESKNPSPHWLCGPNFTAADITLCVLLGRMHLIGISSRYISPSKRPAVSAYWQMAKQQPNVKRVVIDNLHEMKMIFLKKRAKKILFFTAGLGVASAGAWAVYKFVSGRS